MANFNKVLLMGNLTRDPELRFAGGGSGGSGGGGAICKFGLATNRKWRNGAGELQEETCFVDIVVFGRQGETCNEYLQKGRSVFVEGRLNYSSWEDRESGQKRSRLEVVAERVQFLGSRDGGGGGGGGGRGEGGYGRDSSPPSRRESDADSNRGAPQPAGAQSPGGKSGGTDFDFDDIPF